MERKEQRIEDTWDLSGLVKDGKEWEKAMKKLSAMFRKASSFKGHLGDDSDSLYKALEYYKTVSMEAERVGNWAFLMYETDGTDSENMRRLGTYEAAAADFSARFSYFTPELMAIDEKNIRTWMKESRFREYRIWMKKLLREKAHVLSEKEEQMVEPLLIFQFHWYL